MTSPRAPNVTRREVLAAAAGVPVLLAFGQAQAALTPLETAIRALVGNSEVRSGKLKLDVPPLVENGNSVSVAVSVDSPMTPDVFVRRIAIFNEKNPQPNVAIFHLGPRSGRATVSTRIRLATSQAVVAVAELSDGSFWSERADVIVTLAACIEE